MFTQTFVTTAIIGSYHQCGMAADGLIGRLILKSVKIGLGQRISFVFRDPRAPRFDGNMTKQQ
jgi:hypothetical protein